VYERSRTAPVGGKEKVAGRRKKLLASWEKVQRRLSSGEKKKKNAKARKKGQKEFA